MDIQEVKIKRDALEKLIADAVYDFQNETGTFISLCVHNRIEDLPAPKQLQSVKRLIVDLTVTI